MEDDGGLMCRRWRRGRPLSSGIGPDQAGVAAHWAVARPIAEPWIKVARGFVIERKWHAEVQPRAFTPHTLARFTAHRLFSIP